MTPTKKTLKKLFNIEGTYLKESKAKTKAKTNVIRSHNAKMDALANYLRYGNTVCKIEYLDEWLHNGNYLIYISKC